jgi:hypothetical protein
MVSLLQRLHGTFPCPQHVSCYLRSYHQLASQPTGYFSGREGSSIPCVAISRISRLGLPCYRIDVDTKRQIGETQKRGQAPIYKSILLPTDGDHRIMMMLSAESVYYRICQKCTPSLPRGFCGLFRKGLLCGSCVIHM